MKPLVPAGLGLVMLALWPVTSRGDETTVYYHSGDWQAFSGTSDRGQGICGIGITNPVDGRSMAIRFNIGGSDVILSVSKPNWSIPDGTTLAVVMRVGSAEPWAETAVGDGHRARWLMDQTAVQLFDAQFRKASTMTLMFPDGNEPPWTLSLNGSTAADDTFGRCITDLTQRAQAASQTGGPPATQPFGKAVAPAASVAPVLTTVVHPAAAPPSAEPPSAEPPSAEPPSAEPAPAAPAAGH